MEVGNDWWFEGAWSGPFSDAGFTEVEGVFGTGARVHGETVTFASSVGLCDSLFWSRMGDGTIVVANALTIILAILGRRLEPLERRCPEINASLILGLDDYSAEIPTTAGPVFRVAHHDLTVDTGHRPKRIPKPASPPFPEYGAYRGFLGKVVEAAIDNARHPSRKRPLSVLSTQSRGYDSTALNALASPAGVDVAFTVPTAKQVGAFAGDERGAVESDDGSMISAVLGMPSIPIDRMHFRSAPGKEILFRAGIPECQDLNLSGILDLMEGPSLLLTGILGQMWYTAITLGGWDPGATLAGWFREDMAWAK